MRAENVQYAPWIANRAIVLLCLGRWQEACFYAAVTKRNQGDAAACAAGMRQCCALENPLVEEEWYLARAEAGDSAT